MSAQPHSFDAASFSPVVAELLSDLPAASLGPGKSNGKVRDRLERLQVQDLAGPRAIADERMAQACLSGLWLRHNYLDESHELSQNIHTTEGSFWHAIMHRREPDFGNSKYWWRRVGRHAVFTPLAAEAARIAAASKLSEAKSLAVGGSWDPDEFVNLCEQSQDRADQRLIELCLQIQQREWELLFEHCFRHAAK